MKLTFIGASQEVTGSCFQVETGSLRFLVDCGMFQGGPDARRRNLQAWPFDPREIDFVVLTHAHIDHSGLLPRLCALGFRGPIYTTQATIDLLEVMLLDSAFIQESDWARAQRQVRRGGRAPRGVEPPLYTVAQAQECLQQLHGVDYDQVFEPAPSVRCRLRDAGHILGAAIAQVTVAEEGRERHLVFSGDIGQPGRPLVRDPTPIEDADVLVVESTYGNRLHRPLEQTIDEIVEVFEDTLRRRQGNIIVPAFAVGRTQELLVLLAGLRREGRLPPMRVFVDSPMAAKATEITRRHAELLDEGTRELLSTQSQSRNGLDLHFTRTADESMALNRLKAGAVIISASGMCEAGRIRHHLRHHLGRAESAIVIIGFQAAGTLGRRLVDGARRVRILGDDITVRASIHTIGGLSAHADQAGMLNWLSAFRRAPSRTFVVHGEAQTALGFADLLTERLGWQAEAPPPGTCVHL